MTSKVFDDRLKKIKFNNEESYTSHKGKFKTQQFCGGVAGLNKPGSGDGNLTILRGLLPINF